jgi:glycosyl transferase family 2
MTITFVCATNDRAILKTNLLASPDVQPGCGHEILLQRGYSSAAKAYNDAIDKSANDLMVFLHQDIYLPEGWISRLQESLWALDRKDHTWGVAGCWGTRKDSRGCGHVYSSGIGVLGCEFSDPQEIQTLDEIVLVVRKSSRLRFDEGLNHFHWYGTALCLAARDRGMRSYAISAFCVHNSKYSFVLPSEFYEGYRYVKRNWKHHLPIVSPCIRITRFDQDLIGRRLREIFHQMFPETKGVSRVDDPRSLLAAR